MLYDIWKFEICCLIDLDALEKFHMLNRGNLRNSIPTHNHHTWMKSPRTALSSEI